MSSDVGTDEALANEVAYYWLHQARSEVQTIEAARSVGDGGITLVHVEVLRLYQDIMTNLTKPYRAGGFTHADNQATRLLDLISTGHHDGVPNDQFTQAFGPMNSCAPSRNAWAPLTSLAFTLATGPP